MEIVLHEIQFYMWHFVHNILKSINFTKFLNHENLDLYGVVHVYSVPVY